MNSRQNLSSKSLRSSSVVSLQLSSDFSISAVCAKSYLQQQLSHYSNSVVSILQLTREKLERSSLGVLVEKLKCEWRHQAEKGLDNPSQEFYRWMSVYLREPLRIVKTILAKNIIFQRQLEYRRSHTLDSFRLDCQRKSIVFEQPREYSEQISDDKRSRIIAAYHFGDFVYGMNYLGCFEDADRARVVLSQIDATPQYFDNMRRAFGEKVAGRDSQLLSSQSNMLVLSALLRCGNCTLVLFCDLPNGFGELVRVNFLKRKAWFPKGTATLSIVNQTPILPVINYFDGKLNKIVIGRQIEPYLKIDELLEDGVVRITQTLVSFFECFFTRYPEQWRYLQKLPLYFTD